MKKRNANTPAEQELRDLIRSKLVEGMTPDQAADAVFELFYTVEDDWEMIETSTLMDGRGGRWLDQRWLVARIPRGGNDRVRVADRTVTP